MNIPEELRYTRTHEWVRDLGGGKAEIGLTDYAQSELGDLVFVDLPSVGDPLSAGGTLCELESVKAVTEAYSPVSGTVCEINGTLADDPGKINADPYGAWLVRADVSGSPAALMDAAAYRAFAEAEGGR